MRMFKRLKKWFEDYSLKEAARKAEEEKALHESIKKQDQEKYDRNLVDLGNSFQCYICGKKAAKPGSKKPDTFLDDHYSWDYYVEPVDDWSKPGDLKLCTNCNQWVCSEHIDSDICQNCVKP